MNRSPMACAPALLCIAVLAALAAPLVGCTSMETARTVIDREVELASAMQRKDIAALEGLMAPDFRLTLQEIPPFAMTIDEGNPSPGLPGWRWRQNLTGMSFGRIELASVDVKPISGDMVAINMRMTLEEWTADGPGGADDLSGVYELTDIWVNRDGTWRVISRYSRPLDGAARPRPDFVIE
ncbi:MAG: nuclear transport factor 2 family protein [Phycisphaerales bacterium]|nr:nuclear transport factor 2 family protein [Phycisphaerales bacterium]